MSTHPLRLGTRRSRLATTQSQTVADHLEAGGFAVELITMISEGDQSSEPLSQMGGTGVFATRLRQALIQEEVDLVVHSLKDLPTASYDSLIVGAVPPRAPSHDVLLLSRKLADSLHLDSQMAAPISQVHLPEGTRIGTGSPRRRAQLLHRWPGVDIQDIRGNIDTRLSRVGDAGDLDAVVLAAAGLHRSGLTCEHRLDLDWATAPGQGALAVEIRDHDHDRLLHAMTLLHDEATSRLVRAEREVLAALEAGCAAPVAARAVFEGTAILLEAFAYRPDGSQVWSTTQRGVDPVELGRIAADVLLRDGADAIL